MLTQINASAGSGKTYTLTRRFLQLLAKAEPPPRRTGCALSGSNTGYSLAEILAATFTNKAAAEMKTRVVRSLKETALQEYAARKAACAPADNRSPDEAGAGLAELWVERILRHYGSLNIRTIDSLLATLVRLSTLQLGLPPDFEPSFDPAEYFTPLYDALMEELAPPPAASPSQGANQGIAPVTMPPAAKGSYPLDPHQGDDPPGPRVLSLPDAAVDSGGKLEPGYAESFSDASFSDVAFLRARVEEACRNLLLVRELSGFTPKKRLHDALRQLVERLLRGEETPHMDQGELFARLNVLHGRAQEAVFAMQECLQAENLQVQRNFLNFLQRCGEIALLTPLPDSVYLHKECLDDCLNKASRGAFSPEAAERFATLGEALRAYAAALPIFRHALTLAPLTALAEELFLRMDKRIRESGDKLLPALLIPRLASQVLDGENGVSDALCRLGTRLSQLLLDEFQDTSREQWAAIVHLGLESLSTGGSLTYVGDVKQAIYGWRGGDARLFEEVAIDPALTAVSGKASRLTLEYNWRSHPAVVRHNNAFFSLLAEPETARAVLEAMLPPDTPEAYLAAGAAAAARYFADAEQRIPDQKDWQADPRSALARIRLYEAKGDRAEDVQELVRERLRPLLLDELLPAWEYRDIALLVRTGDEAALTASWLAGWGIPVVTENSFLLAANPVVSGMLSFLRFLAYPLDDLAFWEFISNSALLPAAENAAPGCLPSGSPGCLPGCPPGNLDGWLAETARRHGTRRPALYRLYRADFPAQWERFIAPFYSEAGLMSAYDTLMEVVRHFRVAERFTDQVPFIRRLLELAHMAESRGHSSLAAFLAFWRELGSDEKLPLPESMNAVRIMTVHKAKGLEFPVVILPFQHGGKPRGNTLAAVSCHGMRLLTRTGPELPELYYPERITDELERLNLLYVAWTRPVYCLHAFITRPKRSSSTLAKALEVLLERHLAANPDCEVEELAPSSPDAPGSESPEALPSLLETHSATLPQAGAPPDAGTSPAAIPAEESDTPWRPMDWLPRLKIYRSPLPAPNFTARQRGILAHLCLEHLILGAQGDARGAAQGGEQELLRDAGRAVRLGMRAFPLPLDNPEAVSREMIDALFWFARLPLARFWLETGRREQGIMDSYGRMHRVDLLADEALATPPGPHLHAVDYKTGRPDTAYHEQVRRYIRLSAAASGRPVRGFLVYLDERRLEEVSAS